MNIDISKWYISGLFMIGGMLIGIYGNIINNLETINYGVILMIIGYAMFCAIVAKVI